jgi:hypothetical protein
MAAKALVAAKLSLRDTRKMPNPLSHVAPPRAPALTAGPASNERALGDISTKTVVRATPYSYPLLLAGLSNTINPNRDRKGTLRCYLNLSVIN